MTFWIAGALMLLLTMVQLALTAARRDGKSMARVLVGTGQFIMVWAGWIALAVLVVAACGGLTRALMDKLLHIDKWAQFEPLGTQISTKDISDGTVATVLGFMGIFLVFAAIGHLLVMLTRAGALMVLATTTPIAAGGLVSDAGQSWFWKSLRWFIAAAFTPVVMILVLGIGVQMTSGVATGMTENLQKAIGTAVPGVILICVGCFSPLALFKLLAFVDPGTSSGSAVRAGLAAQGGLGGLLSGRGQGDAGSSAASTTDANGRSQAEASGEDSTSARFNAGARGLMGQVGGALGQAVGAGMGAIESIGSRGAAIGADLTNQMGVGHNNYVPDFSKTKSQSGRGQGDGNKAEDDNPEINGRGPSTSPDIGAPTPPVPQPPNPQLPQGPTPAGAPGGSGPGAPGVAAGSEAGGASAAAGAVPIVPV